MLRETSLLQSENASEASALSCMERNTFQFCSWITEITDGNFYEAVSVSKFIVSNHYRQITILTCD